jgi:hypothetical protein
MFVPQFARRPLGVGIIRFEKVSGFSVQVSGGGVNPLTPETRNPPLLCEAKQAT